MSVVNGINACISLGGTSVSTQNKWTCEYTSNNVEKTVSNSAGAPIVLPGVKDWKVTLDYCGRTLPATPGTSYAFIGNNGSGAASGSLTGTVICESVSLNCDVEGGGILSGTATFGGDGAITFSGTAPTDSSEPKTYSGIGCKARWIANGGSAVELTDVRSWSLNLGRAVRAYSSSTAAGLTKRIAGGKHSCSASVVIYESAYTTTGISLASTLAPGATGTLELYINATEYYSVKWGVVKSIRDIGGGADDANLNSLSLDFDWSSYALVSTTVTVGAIVIPSGTLGTPTTTTYWP